MNELVLIRQRGHNLIRMRYHEGQAERMARYSGFSEISYSCEYFADKIIEENRLVRVYRARVLLCDRALAALNSNDVRLLRLREERGLGAEEIGKRFGICPRSVYRRLARAETAFCAAVHHIIEMRKKMRSSATAKKEST